MARYRIDYNSEEVIKTTMDNIEKAREGDERAYSALLSMYSEYIDYMCNKYSANTDIDDDDDLRAIILMGFLEGVNRYDPSKNTKFIYFTHTWMKKLIFSEASKYYRHIRLPVNQQIFKEKFEGLCNSVEDYVADEDATYIRFRALKETETSRFSALNAASGDSDSNIEDNITADGVETTKERDKKLAINIDKVLRKFPPDERSVIEYTFGLGGKALLSSSEIAEELGITKLSVGTIKTRVVRLLRHASLSGLILKNM